MTAPTLTRHHRGDGLRSSAIYSPCERYRYLLRRRWAAGGRTLGYVMLNPSRATERDNDPTIERCQRRADRLGFAAFVVVNLFAFRTHDPRDLRAASEPVGPENDAVMMRALGRVDRLICAWGVHGAHLNRGQKVESQLRRAGHTLYHLGQCKSGAPRHPLYLRYDIPPQRWDPPAR